MDLIYLTTYKIMLIASNETMVKEKFQSAGEIDSWGWYCFYVMSQHRLKSMLVKV